MKRRIPRHKETTPFREMCLSVYPYFRRRRQMTETEYVKTVVANLKKGRRVVVNTNNRYRLHYALDGVDADLFGGRYWWDGDGKNLKDRLARRILKKMRQPYRKNKQRGRMRRKAAGKNEVTRRNR